jgi:hypothetical protein
MLITFLQVVARLLALLAPSILRKKFWFDADIYTDNLPRHIPISRRGGRIHDCDSGPALRATDLPVLLSRRFEVTGPFPPGGRSLFADPLVPPSSKIWQSQPQLVHPAVSKT